MKASTALLVLAASIIPALAVPAPEPEALAEAAPVADGELEKRANTVYVCSGT